MGRILAIDYGLKRTGLAVTDPLKIIATPLQTVKTSDVLEFLKTYIQAEPVDDIIIGMPKTLMNEDSSLAPAVRSFIKKVKAVFPNHPLHEVDERFTSSIAQRSLLEGGMKKKERRKKENIDKISATLILQDFLQMR